MRGAETMRSSRMIAKNCPTLREEASPNFLQPVTAAIVAFASNGQNVREYDVMSAGVLIGALPPLLVYFFGGKYFVRGLTQGAIK